MYLNTLKTFCPAFYRVPKDILVIIWERRSCARHRERPQVLPYYLRDRISETTLQTLRTAFYRIRDK